MHTPVNAFKQSLRDRRPQIGLWMGLASAPAAQSRARRQERTVVSPRGSGIRVARLAGAGNLRCVGCTGSAHADQACVDSPGLIQTGSTQRR